VNYKINHKKALLFFRKRYCQNNINEIVNPTGIGIRELTAGD
jgi:hypothetical protein